MADWNEPTTTSSYDTDVLQDLKGRDSDAVTMFVSAGSNIPTGALRYVRASDKIQEWDGSVWVDKILSIAGGGTGGGSASSARSSLGLGTMATQNDSGVTITGGTISGVSIDAASLGSGTVSLARGGTGNSLTLGANGTHLQSNGSLVIFSTDGSQLTGLNASNLASGTVPAARLPSGVGRLIQVLQASSSTSSASTSSTLVDAAGVTITITPSATTSRILIQASINLNVSNTSGSSIVGTVRLVRTIGATPTTLTDFGDILSLFAPTFSSNNSGQMFFQWLDAPATMSACVYKFQIAIALGSGQITCNANIGKSVVIATELGPN